MWDLPRPGIEPVSLVLTGRVLTTGPPGKSQVITFKKLLFLHVFGGDNRLSKFIEMN